MKSKIAFLLGIILMGFSEIDYGQVARSDSLSYRFQMNFFSSDSIAIIINMKSVNNFIDRTSAKADSLSLYLHLDDNLKEQIENLKKSSIAKDSIITMREKNSLLLSRKIENLEEQIKNCEKISLEKDKIKESEQKNFFKFFSFFKDSLFVQIAIICVAFVAGGILL